MTDELRARLFRLESLLVAREKANNEDQDIYAELDPAHRRRIARWRHNAYHAEVAAIKKEIDSIKIKLMCAA